MGYNFSIIFDMTLDCSFIESLYAIDQRLSYTVYTQWLYV